MLPQSFNVLGALSEDHEVTLNEIRRSLLVRGPEPLTLSWDRRWRATLVDNLEILVRELWAAGLSTIYIDGSFVQDKDHPGDIDGCFECDFNDWNSGSLEKRLNQLAAKKVWGWGADATRLVLGTSRLLMWATYRVELHPYFPEFPTGIIMDDEFVPFPDAYHRFRGRPETKGLLKLRKD